MEQANIAQKSIKFNFQMLNPMKKEHIIEKADRTGQKRRYVRGISSGILKDGDGERMTMNAIENMHSQGKSEDVLLYQGKHGVNFADDIGILTDSSIINKQDWFTEYRLYDEADGLDQVTTGKADKVFRQLAGVHPYTKMKQYGFSIEGLIPESSILAGRKQLDGSMKNRVIDHVDLQGVLLVSKPSYANVADAVYKALKELNPVSSEKLHKNFQNSFMDQVQNQEMKDSFYRQLFSMNDTLMTQIEKIMAVTDGRAEERLSILFDEYGPAMISLILQHEGAFQRDTANKAIELENQKGMESLASMLGKLSSMLQNKIGG